MDFSVNQFSAAHVGAVIPGQTNHVFKNLTVIGLHVSPPSEGPKYNIVLSFILFVCFFFLAFLYNVILSNHYIEYYIGAGVNSKRGFRYACGQHVLPPPSSSFSSSSSSFPRKDGLRSVKAPQTV